MSDPAVALACLSGGVAQHGMAGHMRCWCGWLFLDWRLTCRIKRN